MERAEFSGQVLNCWIYLKQWIQCIKWLDLYTVISIWIARYMYNVMIQPSKHLPEQQLSIVITIEQNFFHTYILVQMQILRHHFNACTNYEIIISHRWMRPFIWTNYNPLSFEDISCPLLLEKRWKLEKLTTMMSTVCQVIYVSCF